MRITHSAEGLTRQWVYVDVGQFSPLSLTPSSPAASSSGWGHERLDDRRLSPMKKMLATLRAAGATAVLVMWEFLSRRIALLQHHSYPMWAFTRPEYPMQIHSDRLSCNVLDAVLQI
ncbi:hypothetical protein D1007_45577 [Hordeum vulgare]|nr:hypothetical protein D1007_45577 [Hordeum vulgare]